MDAKKLAILVVVKVIVIVIVGAVALQFILK